MTSDALKSSSGRAVTAGAALRLSRCRAELIISALRRGRKSPPVLAPPIQPRIGVRTQERNAELCADMANCIRQHTQWALRNEVTKMEIASSKFFGLATIAGVSMSFNDYSTAELPELVF
jgi:hypothetical protein